MGLLLRFGRGIFIIKKQRKWRKTNKEMKKGVEMIIGVMVMRMVMKNSKRPYKLNKYFVI